MTYVLFDGDAFKLNLRKTLSDFTISLHLRLTSLMISRNKNNVWTYTWDMNLDAWIDSKMIALFCNISFIQFQLEIWRLMVRWYHCLAINGYLKSWRLWLEYQDKTINWYLNEQIKIYLTLTCNTSFIQFRWEIWSL